MTRRIEFLPMLQHRPSCYWMHLIWREFGERTQDKAVSQYVVTRHVNRPLFFDQIIVKQKIDIKGA